MVNKENTENKQINQFAIDNNIAGLTVISTKAVFNNEPGYTVEKAKRFLVFQDRINKDLLKHPIITDNHYTRWFEEGEINQPQIQDFIVQFSVFSNLFLIAQLKKMINADSLEGMRASKEILANEIGVIFKASKNTDVNDKQTEYEKEFVSAEGTIEGGTFRFRAAHFEWLLNMAEKLDLGYNDVGKRSHGYKSTLFFCDELSRIYGNEDYMISQAASYAVENWAAAGFWDELVRGFEKYNSKTKNKLPIAFFIYHAKIEAQHAAHTQEELEELYFDREIDEEKFIKYGNEMLEGVSAFWTGLNEHRQKL
ncbi:MAG: hypothetical protein OEM38_07990 [Gammaproteobacteria bacterium]|nr:hypothetical protein [Gammaproteobacteria bacterium]